MDEIDELKQLVEQSKSYSEVILKQGKSVSGIAIKYLKLKLDSLGIPHQHLNGQTSGNIGGNSSQLPLEEILQKDRPYQSNKLKTRLIQSGLKLDQCECCGRPPEWNGKPLTLQLDHINGDHNDNRIENLRILCPNCHSQTDTYGNKQNKKHYYCSDCGKEIKRGSTYCTECVKLHRKTKYKVNPNDRPSKEELLHLIFKTSMTKIGESYGVKDNAVRKWCRNYGIPSTKAEMQEYIKINGMPQ